MKNKFLKDITAFLFVAIAFFIFINSSISSSVNEKPDGVAHIECSNLESNKTQLEKDLPQLDGVSSCKISPQVGMIYIEYNTEEFDPSSVKEILNKWDVDSEDEEDWDFESKSVASSEF